MGGLASFMFEYMGEIIAYYVALFIILLILTIAFLVFYLIGKYKLYEKAGQEGWKAIIPFYATYVMGTDMVGLNWYYPAIVIGGFFLAFIPILGLLFSIVVIVASVNITYNLAKKANKSTEWFIVSIFFGSITIPLLGYSNSTTWNNDAVVDKDGFLASLISKVNSPVQPTTAPSGQPTPVTTVQQPVQPTPVAPVGQPVQPAPVQDMQQPVGQVPTPGVQQPVDPNQMNNMQ